MAAKKAVLKNKKVEIQATWRFKKQLQNVSLHPKSLRGMGVETLYDLVYPYQTDLGLNERARTKVRITIEAVNPVRRK